VVGVVQVAAKRRGGKHRNLKKVLVTSIIVASLGTLAGGTFASFTAQNGNPANTFASGSLVLDFNSTTFPPPVTPNASDCLSTGGGSTDTNSNVCATLVSAGVKKPGDSVTAKLALTNRGSLTIAHLMAYSPVVSGAKPCADGLAAGETYHGSGLPCGKVVFYIQETNSAFTATTCQWGGGTASTCDFTTDATKTLDSWSNGAGAHKTTATALDMGALAPGATRYFVVGMALPSTADNTYQGVSATMDLDWYATQ
jgi:predicted ribosomally synthesized peptide with SipW-like signal peptide